MHRPLRTRRIKARLSVAEMAARLGISESHWYKMEQGKRTPSMALAKRIADIMGTKVDKLFFCPDLDDSSSTSGGARSA